MRESFKEAQFQSRALRCRYASEHPSNFVQRTVPLDTANHVGTNADDHIRHLNFRTALAEGVDCPVSRDYGEPSRQASTANIESVRITPKLHEYFLQNVLRSPRIAKNTQRNRINNSGIALIQLCHGSLIAGANRRHQRYVSRNHVGGSARQTLISSPQSTSSHNERIAFLEAIPSEATMRPKSRAGRNAHTGVGPERTIVPEHPNPTDTLDRSIDERLSQVGRHASIGIRGQLPVRAPTRLTCSAHQKIGTPLSGAPGHAPRVTNAKVSRVTPSAIENTGLGPAI